MQNYRTRSEPSGTTQFFNKNNRTTTKRLVVVLTVRWLMVR